MLKNKKKSCNRSNVNGNCSIDVEKPSYNTILKQIRAKAKDYIIAYNQCHNIINAGISEMPVPILGSQIETVAPRVLSHSTIKYSIAFSHTLRLDS